MICLSIGYVQINWDEAAQSRKGQVTEMVDCEKVGALLFRLRREKGLTQRQLAEQMHLSDRTISKWERGRGAPDISLLQQLSGILGVNIEGLLGGELPDEDLVGGNMKKTKYFVCPNCGNLVLCTGHASISCCGRPLQELTPKKAQDCEKLQVQEIEDDWYITSSHPMTKEHHLSFVAFATSEQLQVIKQYPEWNLQVRVPRRGHGMLLWYCNQDGLFYQLL